MIAKHGCLLGKLSFSKAPIRFRFPFAKRNAELTFIPPMPAHCRAIAATGTAAVFRRLCRQPWLPVS